MIPRQLLIVLPLAISSLACSYNTPPTYEYSARHTSITTDPPGARVYQITPTGTQVDLGTTPINDQPVMVTTGANLHGQPDRLPEVYAQHHMLHVRIEKQGYHPLETNLTTGDTDTIPHRLTLEPLSR